MFKLIVSSNADSKLFVFYLRKLALIYRFTWNLHDMLLNVLPSHGIALLESIHLA